MKLKSAQVDQVLDKLPSEVIPESHPTVPQLEQVFGQHTFFLGSEGLHVVERSAAEGEEPTSTAYVVKVASWTDDDKTSLRPHEAEVTDMVELGPATEDDFPV
ncbi:MAG TPA: hypothetical protein VFG64_15220 [Dongiaceae bacterium]|nr:hypothetical protein [Dongiaceae bacterium]